MSRNKPLPGTRLFLYVASMVGLVRSTEQVADEVGASRDEIDPTTRAEPQDVNVKAVWLAGIGILVVLWAIVLLIYPLFSYYKYERTSGRDPAKVLSYIPKLPPRPRNENEPYLVLQKFRAREASELTSYQWVDRNKGIVSIPIERAIQLLAQRGIPPTKASGDYEAPSAGSMQTGFERKVEPEPR